jgi:hypothetical protein
LLAHHPSGDPTPSESDIKTTRDLIRAGQLLKIEVLDHMVMGAAFCSLRQRLFSVAPDNAELGIMGILFKDQPLPIARAYTWSNKQI